jgi:CheY-like chemotaxis protein
MAASVAHELSSPLAAIVASTQAILAFWPRPATGGAVHGAGRDTWPPPAELAAQHVPLRQLREDLELILYEARRAGEIVHGFLASSRPHPPERTPCSMADLVRRTVSLCRHHLKLHNITLQAPRFDAQEGYPLWSRVSGDSDQLQQVLLDLIISAQQAITAHRGYGTIRLNLAPDGPDRIVLTLEDDGPAVPDEACPRPVTAEDSARCLRPGLSVPAGIVAAHGGEISVEGHPQGGARLRLRLPSLAASERQAPDGPTPAARVDRPAIEPAESGPATPRLTRVLLVDDEHGIRQSVGRFLRRYGFQVTDVPNAQAALTTLGTGACDVIVSDLRMPGLSGEQFFALLQQNFPELARRVVFTSGDLEGGDTRRFLTESGCPALQKPYELSELVQLLRGLAQRNGSAADRRATA